MRLLPVFVALLLASLPLAGAQGDDPRDGQEPDSTSGSDPDDPGSNPQDPEDPTEPGGSGPDHSDRPGAADDNRTGDDRDRNETDTDDNRTDAPTFADRCRTDPDHSACRADRERFRDAAQDVERRAEHVSFEVDRHNRTLLDYAVDGRLLFDAVTFTDPNPVQVRLGGSELVLRTNESGLRLRDTPRGNLEFKSEEHALVLDLSAGARLDQHARTERGHFVVLDYPGAVGKLAADRIVIDDDVLSVYGFAAFHVEPEPPAEPEPSPGRQAVDDAIERAEVQRQLGARVAIRALAAAGVAAESDDAGASPGPAPTSAEVTEFDDMQVNVTVPDVLRHNSTIDVVVTAKLDEGRTVALELDPAVLDGLSVAAGPDVAPRYFDLNDDGTWTEVVFRKAASIHDILDPDDDAGQPEYWIVEDEDGLQVLVSFPHWSTHRVTLTLQEVVEFLSQPSVVVGILAGVGGVAVAAVTLLWPRRRDEDPAFY